MLTIFSLSAVGNCELTQSLRERVLIFIGLAIFTTGVGAHAAQVPVTNTNNGLAGSLRQAVQDANPGDTVVFQIPTTDPGYDSTTGVFTIPLTGGEIVIVKDLTIEGTGKKIVVRRNSATNFRIFNVTAGTVRIANLTITNGSSGSSHRGGGVRNAASLTLQNCAILSSFAYGGGGIDNDVSGILTVSNCTIANNSSQSPGGAGIFNLGSLTINNSTVTKNTVATGGTGGGITNAGATARVRNTIIAGNETSQNVGGGYNGKDVDGAFMSDGYNFIGSVDGSSGFGASGSHDQVGNDAIQADPKLGPLQDNGGLTDTMRPLAGSPVIDQGSRGLDANNAPINTDQRGYSRPIDQPAITNAGGGDGSDIGAVEVGLPQTGAILTVTNTAERNDGCTTDDCTLLEAMNAANAMTDSNTINFAPDVTGVILNTVVPGGLNIETPMTIIGPGARVLTINGNNASRIFNIASAAGTVSISGLTLSSGRAGGSTFLDKCGGALLNAGSLTLSDCTVRNNAAALHGAGIYNNGQNGNAVLTMVRCTLTGNLASGSGAAIFNAAYSGHATSTLTNCTLDRNGATQYGGAVYNDGTSSGNASLTLTNCTLSKNDAGSGAGGIYNDALNPNNNTGIAEVFLQNTILMAGMGANLVNDSASGGTIDSLGNNISNDADGGFLDKPTDRNGTVPGLDTLKNNGGPTDTVALLSNSVARDTGNDADAPATDQRGYFRSGVSDVGAFEFNGIVPLPPSVATNPATDIAATTATLNATVNPNGLATTVQFITDFGSFPVQDAGSGAGNVAVSVNVSGLAPNTTYHYHAVATSVAGTSTGAEQSFTTLPPTTLANVSTRLPVGLGDDALIVGFIITGTQDKKVIIRAIGPSLGIEGQLGNPTLELFTGQTSLGTNDDWMNSSPADQQAIIDSTIPPTNSLESAIVRTLPANGTAYTAVVRGVDNSTGIGVVEVYDLDRTVNSKLANVSTRGLVQTGDNVLFAGMIVLGPGTQKVIIRAIGPSLTIAGKLLDPTLELVNGNGTQLAFNDNWRTGGQEAEIIASTVPPTNDFESAIVATLSGNGSGYTAIVRGVDDSIGIALVEVYALQ